MSENSDSGSDDVRSGYINGGDHDNICRDFLRNVCNRGKRCKYRHHAGEENDSDMGSSSKPELTFCHDFQNMGCHRPSCKFLHCTRAEEEHFHQTGQLPPRMQQSHFGPGGGGGGGGGGNNNGNNHSDIPLCRDYMKGECKRGGKCKYRHIHNDYPDCDLRNDMGGGGGPPPPGRLDLPPRHDMRPDMRGGGPPPPLPPPHSNDLRNNHHGGGYNSFEDSYDKYERYEYIHSGPNHGPLSDSGPSLKRRRLDLDGYGGGGGGGGGGNGGYDSSRYGTAPALSSSLSRPVSYQFQVLEEENVALRRRVEELKKQVADLTATNEVLLEQNARMRVSKSNAVNAVHQMPVTQTLAHAAGTLNLATMAPAAAMHTTALGAAHLGANLTQQIALNSDMATQHALQSCAQRMAREIQHQQAAAAAANPQPRPPGPSQPPPSLGAAPPPGLNPSVTMNPPLASMSMPQNNLVAVSLPSLVTPSSLQAVCPPPMASMAQNLCPPSNPLVSYPIMSQDMRCAVAPSSLAH